MVRQDGLGCNRNRRDRAKMRLEIAEVAVDGGLGLRLGALLDFTSLNTAFAPQRHLQRRKRDLQLLIVGFARRDVLEHQPRPRKRLDDRIARKAG